MIAKVYVTLKNGVLDPQGKAIHHAAETIGYQGIADVRQGKYFEIKLDATLDEAQARTQVENFAHDVLSNPVIEDYRVDITSETMSTATPAIEFRDVSVSFDGVPALQHVSFVLQPGGMICITGDSQSGKSVLLRLAIGLLQPDEGEVWINGSDISHWEETELLALRGEKMGMVFQDAALFTGQSVYENAEYRMSERDWPEEETRRAVLEVLTFVGLQDELDKQAEDLSGGMKRRVEIARALVGWPSIMLFDEPTAGLDPINEYQVLDLIIRARDLHGISSLLVTKALHEIPYLASHRAEQDAQGNSVIVAGDAAQATQVLLLEEGRIAFLGSPQEFAESALPAVQHQLHPVTDAVHDNPGVLEVDDPWDHSRHGKDHLL